MQSDSRDDRSSLRDKIIGLGEQSIRKSYYPQLQQKLEEVEKNRIYLEEKSAALLNMLEDLEEGRNKLATSEAQLRAIVETTPDCIMLIAADGTLHEVNEAGLKIIECESAKMAIGLEIYPFVSPEHREKFRSFNESVFQGNQGIFQYEIIGLKGTHRWLETHAVPLHNPSDDTLIQLAITRDITKRKQTEEEREKLQDQLFRAQKMESIGRLAGGVAHDFSNMLGVIIGNAEMLIEQLDDSDQINEGIKEILNAAQRSADLTRQLLAFARRQSIQPRVLELNDIVAGMLKMLQRLIGENIELLWKPAANLGMIKIDPSQVDQILANLLVNARDAIAGVGSITIETENIHFDENGLNEHMEIIPGDYIMLAVSDSGSGMDNETLNKIFEPFFTTKETGKGTGLGLSTVYGIIKQNNSYINVYSEIGQGTTFKIYFPRVPDTASAAEEILQRTPVVGTETILLVEDEESFLKLSQIYLKRHGYNVLATCSPKNALSITERHNGAIDLLITDIVMPEMNGKDLRDRITALRPDIKVMFMSGYTTEATVHRRLIEEGVSFIQKPFSMHKFMEMVRSELDKHK